MASRIFVQASRRRILWAASGAVLAGGAGVASSQPNEVGPDGQQISPEDQFKSSYGYVVNGVQTIKAPNDWTKRTFKIRVDYPKTVGIAGEEGLAPLPGPDQPLPSVQDAPWLSINFMKEPEKFCNVIREYCYEGNLNPGNEFVLQENKAREWYHAPWMHWNPNGREPLNGLTFERPTPAGELAAKQTTSVQGWACGFYNRAGASTFQRIWNNPGEPNWTADTAKFPVGTLVFKVLMTEATPEQIFCVKGAPEMDAVICPPGSQTGGTRNTEASKVRLLQMDFAVRDPRARETGWVFGTFMFDGSKKDKNPWYRTIPVGIMWGNDPTLTPEKIAAGETPTESWINPEAEKLRLALGGSRPSWGWNGNTPGPGRANGPVDNFVSACSSCHSTSSKLVPPNKINPMIPTPGKDPMHWFRNIPAGQPFEPGQTSGDYSLQLQVGYANYLKWRELQKKNWLGRTMLKIPYTPGYNKIQAIDEARLPLRGIDQVK